MVTDLLLESSKKYYKGTYEGPFMLRETKYSEIRKYCSNGRL